ncbi:ribosome maturation factor RimP [Desulfococcaceae bacterium HSG8]|nr:ribosome maturation factor RimP [Desulfococcaceae bacterium HSG8]
MRAINQRKRKRKESGRKHRNLEKRHPENESVRSGSQERDKEIVSQIKNLAEPLCEAEGMELVHIEYQRETNGRVLRLYIDKPGGVMLDDCASISRQLGDILDVALDTIGPYSLEVTSPGHDRPLGKEADFERFQGNIIKIRTFRPVDGRKNFRGVLSGLTEGTRSTDTSETSVCVKLLADNKEIFIPFQEIARARLVPES